jgi:transcriptional regulator GlxA family with amidase domain
VNADELPGDWLALDEVLPDVRPSLGADGLAGLFQIIEARAPAAPFDARVVSAIAYARRGRGTLSVAAIAREVGATERTLGRLFERHVGMPPSAYLRVLRFNRALAKLRSRGDEGLADVALSLGFADQSHMARDLRELGGLTASDVRGAADFTPASCAGL